MAGEAGKVELRFGFKRPEVTRRTNAPGTCLWCGTKLRLFKYQDHEGMAGRLGAYADNAFCSMRCGYTFGVWAAVLGFRVKEKREKA